MSLSTAVDCSRGGSSSTGLDSSIGGSSIISSSSTATLEVSRGESSTGCIEAILSKSSKSDIVRSAILANSEALTESELSSSTARLALVGAWFGFKSRAWSNADTASAVLPRLACMTPIPYQADALFASISMTLPYDSIAPIRSPEDALVEASSSKSITLGLTTLSPWRIWVKHSLNLILL